MDVDQKNEVFIHEKDGSPENQGDQGAIKPASENDAQNVVVEEESVDNGSETEKQSSHRTFSAQLAEGGIKGFHAEIVELLESIEKWANAA